MLARFELDKARKNFLRTSGKLENLAMSNSFLFSNVISLTSLSFENKDSYFLAILRLGMLYNSGLVRANVHFSWAIFLINCRCRE